MGFLNPSQEERANIKAFTSGINFVYLSGVYWVLCLYIIKCVLICLKLIFFYLQGKHEGSGLRLGWEDGKKRK